MQHDSGTVPEMELGFYILGDIPKSAELERLFGVGSSVTHRAGEPRLHAHTGRQTGTYRECVWGFTSRHIQSNEIEDHVRWLLCVAAPARNLIGARPKASAFIELALVGNSSTVLPSDLIQFVHELNAEIGLVTRRERAA